MRNETYLVYPKIGYYFVMLKQILQMNIHMNRNRHENTYIHTLIV